MAATRRDHNRNFFKWEPEESGNSRFTPNKPMNWLYEIYESSEPYSLDEDSSPDIDVRLDQEELDQEEIVTKEDIRAMTPPNEELLRAATMFPPPPEWFDGDEERLF